ncbi:MAG: hypothetical protein AB1635_16195 [Acidobacteriota bacterium]
MRMVKEARMSALKPLHVEAIPSALAKAERYRLLNEPEQAESICEDVLAADPSNQQATITLILSLTDQFKQAEREVVGRCQDMLKRLEAPYDKAYYTGIVHERRARALLARGAAGATRSAGEWLRSAMQWFEQADGLRPEGNDDARLRWNACARLLSRHGEAMAPASDAREEPLMLE